MASVVLLPGTLPRDQATLRALTAGLPPHTALAARLHGARVASVEGSWSDAERTARGRPGDLPGGEQLHATATANQSAKSATTCAVASPLSAALGLTDLAPLDPHSLQLTEADSRALCETCNQHLRAEGIDLTFVDTHRWLLGVNRQIAVLTERPDWLIGENLRPNLPRGPDARLVERWMNELQMLLYTHPVNIAREDHGLPPVNVIWLWGFSPVASASGTSHGPHSGVSLISDFASAFRDGNLAGWQQAWSAHAEIILGADQIVLGDTHPLLTVTHSKPGVMQSLLTRFARQPSLVAALARLHEQIAKA